MASNTEASRQQLLKSLQGRSLRIPDLQALLKHWPQYVNPELEHLQRDVNERLQRYEMHLRFNLERLSVDSTMEKYFS